MSKIYTTTNYAVGHGTACIRLSFTLTQVTAAYPPPPHYDEAAESAVFGQIMQTFHFLESTPTPTTVTPEPSTTPTTVTPEPSTTPVTPTTPPTAVPSLPPAPGASFDFTSNVCEAQWWSGYQYSALPCPLSDGDARGYAVISTAPQLENGATDGGPGLIVGPQNKYNGYIQGYYPEYVVQPGDHFQATVGCAYGSSCYVTYRLDYRILGGSSGAITTLWSWKERNDGLVYQVDKDLSFLAGKRVSFILTLLATGSATGDRAVWGQPRIVNANPAGPTPTQIAGPVITASVTVTPPGNVYCMGPNPIEFIGSVTTNGPATVAFHWEIGGDLNSWLAGGTLVFTGAGTQTINQGAYKVDCGNYTMSLVIDSPNSLASAAVPFSVFPPGGLTLTPGPSPTPVPSIPPAAGSSYDFTANVCAAQWWSGYQYSALPCPLSDGDARGYAVISTAPQLENGATDGGPGLIVGPQNKYNGYIQGYYPEYVVQPGDHFQATVGCAYGSSCYVTYRLDYRILGGSSGAITTLWSWKERNDGLVYQVDKDLSFLAGKRVSFILTLLATGSATGDRAVWGQPRIVNASYVPPTPTPIPAAGEVSAASVTVTLPGSVYCMGPNPVDFLGSITTNGPSTVTYHWEIGGDNSATTSDETLAFSAAGTQTIFPGAYKVDCGNYNVRLVVTSPNNLVSETVPFSVFAPGSATGVTASISVPPYVNCAGTLNADLLGAITTNGASTVTYHWEISGAASYTSPDTILVFGSATTLPAELNDYPMNCGSYTARLVTTNPNVRLSQASVTLSIPSVLPVYNFDTFQVLGTMACSDVASHSWVAETCNGESGGCQASQDPLFGASHAGFLRVDGNTICGLNLP